MEKELPAKPRGRPTRRRPPDKMEHGWVVCAVAIMIMADGVQDGGEGQGPARCRTGRRWRPKIGWADAPEQVLDAMASAKVVRPSRARASKGSWKKPMVERGPKFSAAIRQPQVIMTHSA